MTDAGSFKLIIEDDEGRRSVVPIDLGEVSIGRLDGNTIRLNERNVSRRHARLVRESTNVVAEDLDSYNGLFINGDRIKGRQELREGDIIRVGDFQLELRGEGLPRRTEDTTQRTLVADIEATQPDIRMAGAPDAAASARSEGQTRDEPTAIIRVDHGDVADQPRRDAKSIVAGQRSKLVCVSTQYAGKEFEINKTEMVLGRTDENDIAIDHRSVSRHHAKIVTSGRSTKIVDLKSANGTLVNGEEYAQSDLKRGDLIELGHVKFRFVPAGENYTFSTEEAAAIDGGLASGALETTLPGPASRSSARTRSIKSNRLVIGAIAGLVLVIIGMIVWVGLSSGPSEENLDTAGALEPLPMDGSLTPVAVGNGQTAGKTEADKLATRAALALEQRQWQQAGALAKAALALDPAHAKAKAVADGAEQETAAQGKYDSGVAAINNNAWSEAWNHLQEIPPESYYAKQAASLMEQVKEALIAEKITEGESAIRTGDWNRAETLADEIIGLDPNRSEAEQIRAAAGEGRKHKDLGGFKVRSKTPRAKTVPTKAKVTAPTPVPTPTAKPATAEDPEPYYSAGRNALTAGQYPQAIDQFNKCIKADKKYCLCYRALGIAYAKQRNGPKAYRFYKQYLKVCPNTPDAPQVQGLLEQYEQAQ